MDAPPRRRSCSVCVLNDRPGIQKMIAQTCNARGFRVTTAQLVNMRVPHKQIQSVVLAGGADVLVFDVATPYESNWDFLELLRLLPGLKGVSIIATTGNKRDLEALVGPTDAVQCLGTSDDVTLLVRVIEKAMNVSHPRRHDLLM